MKKMMRLTTAQMDKMIEEELAQGIKHSADGLEAIRYDITSPCCSGARLNITYYRPDGMLALQCFGCGQPAASFLIADQDPLN